MAERLKIRRASAQPPAAQERHDQPDRHKVDRSGQDVLDRWLHDEIAETSSSVTVSILKQSRGRENWSKTDIRIRDTPIGAPMSLVAALVCHWDLDVES